MTDITCGCCEGVEPVTPRPTGNRPGLSKLSYRIGTHPDFLQTMIARLTSHALENGARPLQQLTTRAADDPTIALLDAWATVADVLTFYQERIANEGFLMSATERRSILELGRLVGYRLRPGVAASTYLAFTLEDDFEIEIPAHTLARSLPEPEENPEPFETAEPLEARTAWSALPARRSMPFLLEPETGFSGTRLLYLQGTAINLSANDAFLAVRGTKALPYVVRSIETDDDANLTRVHYADKSVPSPAAFEEPPPVSGISTLTQLSRVVEALRIDPSAPPPSRFKLTRSPQRTYAQGADLGPRLLTEFDPALRETLFTAYANAPVSGFGPEDVFGVEAMRVKAAPFGATAPLEFVYQDNVVVGRREWPLAEIRTALDLQASVSESSTLTLPEAFLTGVDLSAGEVPPVRLALSIADAMTEVQEILVALDKLEEVEPPADGGRVVFARDFERPGGVRVTVTAEYFEDDDGMALLRNLSAIYQSPQEHRQVVLSPSTVTHVPSLLAFSAVVANAVMRVAVSGIDTQDVPAGAQPLQLTGTAGRQITIAFDADGRALAVTLDETQFAATSGALRILSLDGTYDGIVPGGRVILDRPRKRCEVYFVEDLRTAARADYGISQNVTQLLLDRAWLSENARTLAAQRSIAVYGQNEALDLAEEPIATNVGGAEIELDGLYEGLEAGRWVVVKGERTDVLNADGETVEGIEASELAMIAGTEHALREVKQPNGNIVPLPSDTLHTRLILAEPLAYGYRRDTVEINANVVPATHGETMRETLGSADSASAFQRFDLGQSPLTYLAAANANGVESTLEVRVNDIRWPERETLLALGSRDRGYQTKTDDEGVTSIIFGDGKRGALPPSGIENVTAVYRAGIGNGGNVKVGQISTLSVRPLGVKEVINPIRASGGADPESRDQARERVPLAVQALDRLVSVEDYTHFTRLFAGIGKAHATRISDGSRTLLHLTIAGAEDAPIDVQSDLYRNLLTALVDLGDPSLPLQVAMREAIFVFLNARVKVLPEYLWEKVEPKLRAALLETFGFERRVLGQQMLLSEIVSVMQGIEGVDYVDIDLFEGVSEADAESPETLAETLAAFANLTPGARPKQRLAVELARTDPGNGAGAGILPAQIAYLSPGLADTLILTEVTQ